MVCARLCADAGAASSGVGAVANGGAAGSIANAASSAAGAAAAAANLFSEFNIPAKKEAKLTNAKKGKVILV